ncbi:MAG: DUF1593 domain-containing protein [Bryobacterales bacterium]|jgi:hypothetical protein|nr:DUF1593 domain-containing protein [Bryobacterales bacterium]
MMRTLLLITLMLGLAGAGCAQTTPKPRVFVLTDISNEPDDEESLVRFLVYANEYDVEGLVATTSTHLRDKVRLDLIHRQLDAYQQVLPNLRLHAEGYPSAERLRAVARAGVPRLGMEGVGPGMSTDGSRLLIEAADRDDPRPLWVLAWGGPNVLAQALWEVRATRSPIELAGFIAKLRVYTISDQDDSGRWMRIQFPDLYYVVSPSTVQSADYYLATWSGIGGDRFYRNGPGYMQHMVDNPWLEENIIRNHGPLGALYPRVAYIMEGDTPSFLNLIQNGLGGDIEPSYGGWGGRYALRASYGETRPIWTNSRDTVTLPDGTSHTSNTATIWRWREHFQNDFAARMDWCVKPRAEANHNPVAVVNGHRGNGPIRLKAQPRERIRLSASASTDPDGNALSYRWYPYPEAGTFRGQLVLTGADAAEVQVDIPADARPGVAHILLEVKDSGSPALFRYRRVIVDIDGAP